MKKEDLWVLLDMQTTIRRQFLRLDPKQAGMDPYQYHQAGALLIQAENRLRECLSDCANNNKASVALYRIAHLLAGDNRGKVHIPAEHQQEIQNLLYDEDGAVRKWE